MSKNQLGIPYARKSDESPWYEECPICGELCPEVLNDMGEQTQGTYTKHYADAHKGSV